MINLKKFGFLEIIVFFSALYVLSTLLWTASTRSAVEEKANIIKDNHKIIVDFVNNQINTCDGRDDNTKTSWGESCNDSWTSTKIINYINSNLNLKIFGNYGLEIMLKHCRRLVRVFSRNASSIL